MNNQTPNQTPPNQSYDPYAQQLAYSLYDQPGIDPEGGCLHPKHILRVMRRKWLTILLVAVFALAAGFFYLHKATPIYRAQSQIEISVRQPRILSREGTMLQDEDEGAPTVVIFNTRLERLRSRAVMEMALDILLEEHPDALAPANASSERTAEQDRRARLGSLRRGISIDLRGSTRIVEITFEHPDPVITAAVCNAFAEAAAQSALEENRASSDAAVSWLEEQEEIQSAKLQEAEAALLQHLADSGLNEMRSRRNTVDEALSGFNRSLVQRQSEESRAQDIRLTLEALDLSPDMAGELPSGIPHESEIRSILEQWRRALVSRQQLLARYTDNHPEVQSQNRLIDLYSEQAQTLMTQAMTTAQANEELLKQQAETLESRINRLNRLARQLDRRIAEAETERAALQRSKTAAEEAYRGILARIQDARIAADENTATIKILDRASTPGSPIQPQSRIVLALAVALGLGAGTGLALLVDQLEDQIIDPDDVIPWGISLLGIIPHVKKVGRSSVALASLRDRFSQVTEAFAGLRAMLDSPQYNGQAQVILVSSSLPGEGKTVTSCNLAAAWAQKKRRVLLIDFDQRRPRLASIFGMPQNQPGLLSVLSGDEELTTGEDLVFQSPDCPTLDIIATRPVSGASPAELTGTKSVENLLSWARKHYDHIVIDAPPLGIVSDALALAPLADTVLVMVRPKTSRKKVSKHTIHRFQESGIQNIALIMNDLDFSKMGYGPYYHYNKHYKADQKA